MRNLLVLLFLILIVFGCGKPEHVIDVQIEAQAFEGFYYCDNNSNIELVTDYNNSVIIETYGQSLNSVNPVNNTLATHPVMSYRDLVINGNRLVILPRNYTYSSSTHDVETDTSGANITGRRRTDVSIVMNNKTTLVITIQIYANAINTNINSITANRVINCKK